MTVIFAILLAKFLSPIGAVLGLAAGYFARRWWQIVIAAAGIAALQEVLLAAMQYTYRLKPAIYLIGLVAAGIWCSIIPVARLLKKRNKP